MGGAIPSRSAAQRQRTRLAVVAIWRSTVVPSSSGSQQKSIDAHHSGRSDAARWAYSRGVQR